jgi:hypothetical protein
MKAPFHKIETTIVARIADGFEGRWTGRSRIQALPTKIAGMPTAWATARTPAHRHRGMTAVARIGGHDMKIR